MKYVLYLSLLFVSTLATGQIQYANLELNKDVSGGQAKIFGNSTSTSHITWGKIDTQEPNDYALNLLQGNVIQNCQLGFNLSNNSSDNISFGYRDEVASLWYRVQFSSGKAVIKTPTQNMNLGSYAASDQYVIIKCGDQFEFYVNDELKLTEDNPNPDNSIIASLQLIAATSTIAYIQIDEYAGDCDEPAPDGFQVFVELNYELQRGYVNISDAKLGITYKEKYAISTGQNDIVKVNIYDTNRNLIVDTNDPNPNPSTPFTFQNHYGQNFKVLDLAPFSNNFMPGEIYDVEVKGTNKNSTFYLRFKYAE